MEIRQYIRNQERKGHSRAKITAHMQKYGHHPEHIKRHFQAIDLKRYSAYFVVSLILFVSFSVLFFRPAITGNAVFADNSYPGVKFASADYKAEKGLVYQGENSGEKIYLDGNLLNLQGKQYGSLNIVDYNNDGAADLFTTGFYVDANGEEVASTTLYDSFSKEVGDFVDLKYSSSCWADFDNNGYYEPAMMGEDNKGNQRLIIYKNEGGEFSILQEFAGLSKGTISCMERSHNFMADIDINGFTDLIACGDATTYLFLNDDGNFKQETDGGLSFCDQAIAPIEGGDKMNVLSSGLDPIDNTWNTYWFRGGNNHEILDPNYEMHDPKIATADIDLDNYGDIVIIGDENGPKTRFLPGGFSHPNLPKGFYFYPPFEFTNAKNYRDGELLFYNDGKLKLFLTGQEQSKAITSQLLSDFTTGSNSAPNPPQNLRHTIENNYIKLEWDKAEDDHTEYPYYHVRAGNSKNPNAFLSGIMNTERGNAETNTFKLLKDPEECIIFQVKAIDLQLKASEWSEKYYVNCDKEEKIEINETNTTIEMPAPIENLTEKRWTENRNFHSILYHAEYETIEDYILLTEIIVNSDVYTRKDVKVMHKKRFSVLNTGSYGYEAADTLSKTISSLEPGERKILYMELKGAEQGQTLPIQIDSKREVLKESAKKEVNVSVIVDEEKNKTIIPVEVRVDNGSIAEEGVVVKQTLPKCLIEKINELVLDEGKVTANRKFEIIEEDPVIMWHFESIIDPELLKLEIAGIADENCTNLIKTEIVANKIIASRTEASTFWAFIQLAIPILLIVLLTLALNKMRKQEKRWNIALMLFAVAFIILNIFDALAMLPASIDFFKKILSWVFMLSLLFNVSLRNLLFTGEKKDKGHFFNILLITSFVLLSIKNITFIAFKTHFNRMIFGDLATILIQNSKIIETTSFSIGVFLFLILVIISWLYLRYGEPSFAALLHKTERNLIGAKHEKLLVSVLILSGFFITFFNFLFGWFSIAFDAPFLIIALIITISKLKIKKAVEAPDMFIEGFLKLFTHRKNIFIAFSAFPILIFIVESYNYLAYVLAGIKSIYYEAIPIEFPTLIHHYFSPDITTPLYFLQAFGLIASAAAAFFFWWHFFAKREGEGNELKDRPHRPLLFAFIVSAFASYLLLPTFKLASLSSSKISGVSVMLVETIGYDHLPLLYAMLTAIFIVSWLGFAKWKGLSIVPYFIVITEIVAFSWLFINGFVDRMLLELSTILLTDYVKVVNVAFVAFFLIIFVVVMIISYYSLLGEFFALFGEEFGHQKWYRRTLGSLFRHKVNLTKEQEHEIEALSENLLDEGEEPYLVAERIKSKTGFHLKDIMEVLHKVEKEEDDHYKIYYIDHRAHEAKHLEQLRKHLMKLYWEKNQPLPDIIEDFIKQGWSQDDIAAAFSHIRPKKKDRLLFQEMRRDI